ncbi:MAG: 2-oxo-4-hydroxy-4-carboxy-5-ureidoimidazoline decarboxylase [Candidatus Puniceispirillaceae bacterium]
MAEASFTTPPGQLDQADFLTQFGGIYEHSPWVAQGLWDAGFPRDDASVSRFAARMAALVDAAGRERQLALLRAHPELAGKLAVAGGLTAESTSEQASAGLDRCTPDEFAAFTDLNARYGARFGHPFIIAVRGLDRAAILAAFTARVENDPDTEFAAALAEVHKIARLRLELLADRG